jgi:hypothetical protein
MITLTTPIVIPNVNRIRVTEVLFFDRSESARVYLSFLAAGGRSLDTHVNVTNAGAMCLDANAAAVGFDDFLSRELREMTGAYDAIEAAYRSGATRAAAKRNVAQKLLDLGILGASLAGENA